MTYFDPLVGSVTHRPPYIDDHELWDSRMVAFRVSETCPGSPSKDLVQVRFMRSK